MSKLFTTLAGAVRQELGAPGSRPQPINSFRRNLQRMHAESLSRLLLDAGAGQGMMQTPVPEHARSLARLELMDLSDRLGEVLEAGESLDRDTRAHLVESRVRIDRALETALVLPVK